MTKLAPHGERCRQRATLLGALALVIAAWPATARPQPPPQSGSARSATVWSGPTPALRSLPIAPIVEAVRALSDGVKRVGGTASVAVLDVGSGEVLAAENAHLALNPASNAKLATAATALARVGPGYRWLTGLYGEKSGADVGELVLRGQGDPTLRAHDLGALAHELASSGVRRVGGIAVDQSYFDARYLPPAFEQQPEESSSFRAPVAAVSLEGNSVVITVRPNVRGEPALVDVAPAGFVDVTGLIRTTAKKDPEQVLVTLTSKGDRLLARVGGHVPDGGRVVRLARRVDDPRLYAGYVLREALREAGIQISGNVRTGGNGSQHLLCAHRSAPLGQVLGALGKDSNNFVAEMLFKALGAVAKGRPATTEAAAESVTEFLRAIDAFEPGSLVRNGSGLFDANRTTAHDLTALLRATYRDPAIGPELLAQLSIGGVDGTLRARFRPWASTRAIRAKSGTLNSVVALSGYVLAPAGRAPIAFATLANGIPGKVPVVRPLLDAVVDAIAKQLWAGGPRLLPPPTPAPARDR